MNLVTRDQQHFLFDRNQPPVLRIKPGEEVTFETLDACCGEVRTVEQFLQRRTTTRPSNPIAGPVYVEGAQPGDTLVVEILKIDLDETGFQLIGPKRAIVRDEIPEWTCHAFRTEGQRVIFPNGIEVPANPVIGQFGNAPAGDPTALPNRLGGNQDVPAVRTGARLHIPIEVPGAIFSLGDVHACQGDGEVVGAPEIGARVTVRLSLRRGAHSEWFMIEDADCWHTPCTAETEYEASRRALFHNAHFIAREYHVELKDALLLLTLIGKLSLSRTGTWGTHGPVVTSSFSKDKLRQAIARYRKS